MSRPLAVVVILIVTVIAAWLLYPILNPVPVEGFSAAILSLAVHLAHGNIQLFDQIQPFNLEFFTLSKLGAVLATAGLVKWAGIGAESALRILIWCGEAVLLVSTVFLVRRWSGVSTLAALIATLLVPGVIENSFFYSENVIAAALTTSALVCFGTRSIVVAPLIGGALFGLGALTRPDTILVATAVPLIVILRDGFSSRSAISLAAATITGAITLFGTLHLVGASILDVAKVGRYAMELWNRPVGYFHQLREIVVFVGLPAGMLATLGVVSLVRQRELRRLALLLTPIAVVNTVFVGSLWQSRQLLPLAPFVVTLTAIGLMQLVPSREIGGSGLWIRRAAVVIIAAILLLPLKPKYDDGPRDIFGRIPGIAHWLEWQSQVSSEIQNIRRFAEADRSGVAAIVTEWWNEDRYVHFALVDAGFRVQKLTEIEPACAAIAESFVRGPNRVLLIRIHLSFVPDHMVLMRERLDTMAQPCLQTISPSHTALLTSDNSLRSFVQNGGDISSLYPPDRNEVGLLEKLLESPPPGRMSFLVLDEARMSRLHEAFAAVEVEARRRFTAAGRKLHTKSEGIALTGRILTFPTDK